MKTLTEQEIKILKEELQKYLELTKVLQLKIDELKKLFESTTKNPEHCCEAFEYLRNGIQKIMVINNVK